MQIKKKKRKKGNKMFATAKTTDTVLLVIKFAHPLKKLAALFEPEV
jgi:hypothetical protein